MKNERMIKMKWTILSALVWVGFANMTYEKFRDMLLRPDYADLLQSGNYTALFKKREILVVTDNLSWDRVWVGFFVFWILGNLVLLANFLLGFLWK